MPKGVALKFHKMMGYLKNNYLLLIVFCTYVILTFLGVTYHEPFRDEAQAWLIARDCSLCHIFFHQMSYEGTPGLWHLILIPFAKSGVPYISENIIHLVIAIFAATIFLFYAPFSKVVRASFILSYYMIYEYAVIARNYNLTLLLLFLIAVNYPNRFNKPLKYSALVALLFNTNVHTLFMAIGLLLAYIYERKHLLKEIDQNDVKVIAGILLMVAGGILAFIQIIPRPDNRYFGLLNHIDPEIALEALLNAFFPWFRLTFPHFIILILLLWEILILYLGLLSIKSKPIPLSLFVSSLFWLLYIFVFKYPGGLRHHGLILVFFLFALWIGEYYSDKGTDAKHTNFRWLTNPRKLFSCLLVLSFFCSIGSGGYMIYNEYEFPFSGAKAMAGYIMSKGLTQCTIVAHMSPQTSALLPYLPNKKFWYADIESFGTYITWNRKEEINEEIPNSEVIRRMKKAFPKRNNLLLLLNTPLKRQYAKQFSLLKYTGINSIKSGESFFLYCPISHLKQQF